ncbi:MAG: CPBP family intramembrane metalloprotease [Thermoanaerobaculia bacterium]|nr:CPBP family intramembrane metalloprotease [Thermoanaerobaculia bacterium]
MVANHPTPPRPRRLWWLLAVGLSLVTTWYAWTFFSSAYPIASLDSTMDRAEALSAARSLADQHGWLPAEARSAASFGLDSGLQHYVELEAGGASAFIDILSQGRYSPFTWSVRLFREGDLRETRVFFTPTGRLWGFVEILPEDLPGAALEASEARGLAEEAARQWGYPVDTLEPIETAQQTLSNGRVDHTFIYRYPQPIAGDAEQRQSVVVSGDRVTEIGHFIRIPEAFQRRYQEMRSANEAIANASGVATFLLLIVGGCGLGLLFLQRAGALRWKPALLGGVLLATLQTLDLWNQWPLIWMSYDTALSRSSYILRQLTGDLSTWFTLALSLTLLFAAAEGLTRLAFPLQPQIFKLASRPAAASRQVFNGVVLGYLAVPLFMAYEVALYFVAQGSFGWWTPTTTLFDPDVIATYLPWFSPLAASLQAGILEECLFRAVPLASAILIGRRFGRPRAWLTFAMLSQAVIFAAGHANYATQPSYARLVELLLPALFFGVLYLTLGLLPAILMHFAYDVVWFSLPLFTGDSVSLADRLLVVSITLLPLLWVLFARIRQGNTSDLSPDLLNAADSRPSEVAQPTMPRIEADPAASWSPNLSTRSWVIIGLLGGLVAVLVGDTKTDAPPLPVTRAQAIESAEAILAQRGVTLGEDWQRLAIVDGEPGVADDFVWNTDRDQYQAYLGKWLRPPVWRVRFARFEGALAERAEEWGFNVDPQGEVIRTFHGLPEDKEGPELGEDEARQIVRSTLASAFGISPDEISEESVQPIQRPHRRDWTFTQRPEPRIDLGGAEPRIIVSLAGSEVSDASRFLHLPEDWLRARRDRRALLQAVDQVATLFLTLAVLASLAAAARSWRQVPMPRRAFLTAWMGLTVVEVLAQWTSWPTTRFYFSTTEPVRLQALQSAGIGLLLAVMIASAVALLAITLHGGRPRHPVAGTRLIIAGVALGVTWTGILAAVRALGLSIHSGPGWGDYSALSESWPMLATANDAVRRFAVVGAIVCLLLAALDHWTEGFSQRRTLALGLLWMTMVALVSTLSPDSLGQWVLLGSLLAVVVICSYLFLLRREPAAAPVAVGVLLVASTLGAAASDLYPGARSGSILGALAILVVAWFWSRSLNAHAVEASVPIG